MDALECWTEFKRAERVATAWRPSQVCGNCDQTSNPAHDFKGFTIEADVETPSYYCDDCNDAMDD